jgi:myo-inositol-1(or 4)-monophosphatase
MFTSSELKHLEIKSSEIVKNAGKFVRESWSEIKKVSYKDVRDVFTNVDVEAENMLRTDLEKLLPEAGFVVEEGKTTRQTIYNWVIDPIDQTKNYVAQFPVFYVQIALLENNIPILTHIYNPISDQLFSASKSNGVFLNGTEVEKWEGRDVNQAIVEVDFGGNSTNSASNIKILTKFFETFYRVRMLAGALSPYMITKAIDGYVDLSSTTKPGDIAPRIMLLTEAGFKVEEVRAKDRNILVAGSEKVFGEIKKIITEVS